MAIQRKFYEKMLNWKKTGGKTALLIEGARRIGKSTLAETFAQNEYDDYILLDFSEEDDSVLENFKHIGNLDRFFQNLFLLKGKTLTPRKSVIIFDEVQLYPRARQAIKKLVKDGRYDYIETGSLISIKKNVKDILIPSEERRIKMYPLDFEEFLNATGNSFAYKTIREAFTKKQPLQEIIHRRMMELFRTYMAVGGMPQAVVAYIEGKSYSEIDSIKQDILDLYENDLRKYDNENREKSSVVFKVIPEQLAKRNAIFKFSLIDKNARYRNFVDAVDFVAESMIGNICVNVTEPDIALELYADRSNFKLYQGDTGLFVTQMMKLENKDNLYKSIIFDKTSTNLGILYENMVAQMLACNGHKLYFHEFKFHPENQEQEKKYEIDFLMAKEKRIIPVEVKSSNYRQHKSIDYLKQKYPHIKVRDKYVIYNKNLEVKDGFTYIPIYMAGLL